MSLAKSLLGYREKPQYARRSRSQRTRRKNLQNRPRVCLSLKPQNSVPGLSQLKNDSTSFSMMSESQSRILTGQYAEKF